MSLWAPLVLVLLPALRPEGSGDARAALDRALGFLVKSQNADGSWGSPRNALPIDLLGWNHGNHDLFRRATTALACMALVEAGSRQEERRAADRALAFLLRGGPSKRPSDWEVYNVWSYVYSLQCFAKAHGNPRFQVESLRRQIREAGAAEIEALRRYQSPSGGWGYYEDESLRRPSWATSFTTAAAVLALVDAKREGFAFPERMLERAVQAVSRCRLPNGAYTYSVLPTPAPGGLEWIDQVKGSLGRIQVGNLALFLGGKKLAPSDLRRGLELLFEHHRFLDVAWRKPWPHEAYYYNSGYFYFFAHHYAAMAIELLPEGDRDRYWTKLQEAILRCQEGDGAVWDWFLNDYAKPYATAFAAMALARSLRGADAKSAPTSG